MYWTNQSCTCIQPIGVAYMTLTETQCKVLLEIGSNEGENAYSIAQKLKRDQSGINRACGKLRRQGLVSATPKTNEGVNSNELKLTLLGFSQLVAALHERYHLVGYRIPPKLDEKITSLLRNNRDLHEGLGIFYEYFSHGEKLPRKKLFGSFFPTVNVIGQANESTRGWVPLVFLGGILSRTDEYYELLNFQQLESGSALELEKAFDEALYKDLFFALWESVESQNIIRKDIRGDRMDFFRNSLLPKFRESKGWPAIARELKYREAKCEQLRVLKTLVD